MDNSGWIKLHRKILKTSWFSKPYTAHLAMYLILNANWEPASKTLKRQKRTIEIGQLVTGFKKISLESGLSIQNLRTALEVLSNSGFLTKESTNEGTIITIVKYKDYQILEKDQQANQQTINKRSTNDQQTINNIIRIKELKELKELKNKDIANRQKKPIVPLPECVAIYRDVFHYSLNPSSRAEVESVVSEEGKLKLWREILTEWSLRGWNPRNIKGMIDCFKKGGIENKYKNKYDHNMDVAREMINQAREENGNGGQRSGESIIGNALNLISGQEDKP